MSLKKQVFNGLVWTYAEQFGGQLINFFVNIILARTLIPDDFGVLGVLYIFITIANVLVDGGMKTSIIRKFEVTENDYSSVFYANILISLILYVIIFLFAPFIADFFKNQEIKTLLRVFSLIILIQAFVFVQSAILTRNLDFKKQAKMKIPSIILSSVIGLIMALNNYGVWSLVIMYLTQNLFWAISHWMFSSWKPKRIFDKNLFKSHFNFGYKLTIVEIMNSITANMYQIVIGRYYLVVNVGYYTQSLTLRQLPIANIYGAASKLFLPIFSKIQNNEEKLITGYLKILSILLVVLAPILIYMSVFSEQLIVLLYSEKWRIAAPFLLFLAFSGLFSVVSNFNLSVLSIIGDSKLLLKIEIINKIQRVVFIIVAIVLAFAIKYFLYIILLSAIVNYFIANFYAAKYLKVKNSLLVLVFLRFLTFSIVAAICSYYISNHFKLTLVPIIDLGISVMVGMLAYVGLIFLFNREIITEFIGFFKKHA